MIHDILEIQIHIRKLCTQNASIFFLGIYTTYCTFRYFERSDSEEGVLVVHGKPKMSEV